MKRLFLCILLCCLVLSSACAESTTIFDLDFFLQTGIYDENWAETLRRPNVISVAASGDSAWALLDTGDVWRYDVMANTYSLVTQVSVGKNTATPLSRFSAAEREQQESSVFRLLIVEDQLYGFNPLSGRYGPIDEQGVHWNDNQMNTDPFLRPGTAWQDCYYYATPLNDRLYVLCDLVQTLGGTGYQPALASCSLLDQDCAGEAIPGLLALCRYDDQHLLFLTMTGLERYNVDTRKTTPLNLTLPAIAPQSGDFWDIHEAIGGLAYDQDSDTIYLATPDTLYTSTAGADFVGHPSGQDWSHSLSMGQQGFLLDNGAYVLYGDGMTTHLMQP